MQKARVWRKPHRDLKIEKILLDIFPYTHFDVWAYKNNIKYVFGVPYDRNEGMAFYYIDEYGARILQDLYEKYKEYAKGLKCCFCDEKMVLTKLMEFGRKRRLQFKCIRCFLTRYQNI